MRDKRIWVGKSETNPRAHIWDKEWRNGCENNPKAGTVETFRNSICCSRYRDLVPNAPRRGRRREHLTLAPALPQVHEDPTDDKPRSSSDSSSSSSSSTQAPSGIPQHMNVQARAETISGRQPQTVMGANVPVVPASIVLPTTTPKALIRTLDVPPGKASAR